MTRKSLSVAEELAMLSYFGEVMNKSDADGKDVAVMLMMMLGVRNQEACGLTYGAIKQIADSEYYGAYIYQKVEDKKHDPTIGGKTRNAYRIIPMFNFLKKYIDCRKEHVQDLISKDKQNVDISKLPIGCKCDEYMTFCNPGEITEHAKNIFKHLGISNATVTEVQNTIIRLLREGTNIEEEDPRAYLMRKNYGTHLDALEFTAEEIQYIIGHNIENELEDRNDFVNDDRLVDMARRMQNHPYCVWYDGSGESTIEIELEEGSNDKCVVIEANEPGGGIAIEIEGDKKCDIEIMQGYKESKPYGDKVDIKTKTQKMIKR